MIFSKKRRTELAEAKFKAHFHEVTANQWHQQVQKLREENDRLREANREERVTSATGGQKDRKLAELGSTDPVALLELAKVSGHGARKYSAFNFLKGYDWALSFNAMQRHALAFWSGEEHDPESGLPHMAHAAWHALALTSFLIRDIGTDTRFKGEQ